MRKVARLLIVAITLVGTTLIVGTPPASAAPCGFSEDDTWAYWTNCSYSSNDYIHVDLILWPDRYLCVPAQSTMNIGNAIYTRGAVIRYFGCPL